MLMWFDSPSNTFRRQMIAWEPIDGGPAGRLLFAERLDPGDVWPRMVEGPFTSVTADTARRVAFDLGCWWFDGASSSRDELELIEGRRS